MLKQTDIVSGLRELGLAKGDNVLIHSSLVALGQVEGGASMVVDALLEAVGPEGLVVVPTFACKPPFDRKVSATPLGAIPDRLWRRPNAVRSLHPTHSVAAIGKGAEELIKDHEKASTAYAEGTPYYNLAMMGGKVLLLGVDQDRNTTLHTAEALAGSPYLKDIRGTYVDDDGKEVTIPIAAMAGPHRDFIGLDRLFKEHGVMKVGKIGNAVCRLMDGKTMIETAVEAMRLDPAAVLCDNPACADCIMQRGKIKAARLANESFTLAAVAGDISNEPGEILDAIRGEGISALEITADEYRQFGDGLAESKVKIIAVRGHVGDRDSAELAEKLGVPLIVLVHTQEAFEEAARMGSVLIENDGAPSFLYAELYSKNPNAPKLAFNPGYFVTAGEKPFLEVFYRGTMRKQMAHFYIDDATFDGKSALPGKGNGEVKEIISMLRCRSYGGVMTLRSRAAGVSNFRKMAKAFWRLLDNM